MEISREQARELDRRAIEEFGVPSLVLMENAGRGAAELLLTLGVHGPVAICCGKGNNGGDGLVMARHLHNRGTGVKVHLFGRPEALSPDAAVHWRIVTQSMIPTQIWSDGMAGNGRSGEPSRTMSHTELADELALAEWVVDALFGTGLTGPVRPPFDRVIAAINSSPARVLAVDIPSGLDCDTGEPMGPTVRARHTATFLAAKKGYNNPAARNWLGKVHVVDIGAPIRLLKELRAS